MLFAGSPGDSTVRGVGWVFFAQAERVNPVKCGLFWNVSFRVADVPVITVPSFESRKITRRPEYVLKVLSKRRYA